MVPLTTQSSAPLDGMRAEKCPKPVVWPQTHGLAPWHATKTTLCTRMRIASGACSLCLGSYNDIGRDSQVELHCMAWKDWFDLPYMIECFKNKVQPEYKARIHLSVRSREASHPSGSRETGDPDEAGKESQRHSQDEEQTDGLLCTYPSYSLLSCYLCWSAAALQK